MTNVGASTHRAASATQTAVQADPSAATSVRAPQGVQGTTQVRDTIIKGTVPKGAQEQVSPLDQPPPLPVVAFGGSDGALAESASSKAVQFFDRVMQEYQAMQSTPEFQAIQLQFSAGLQDLKRGSDIDSKNTATTQGQTQVLERDMKASSLYSKLVSSEYCNSSGAAQIRASILLNLNADDMDGTTHSELRRIMHDSHNSMIDYEYKKSLEATKALEEANDYAGKTDTFAEVMTASILPVMLISFVLFPPLSILGAFMMCAAAAQEFVYTMKFQESQEKQIEAKKAEWLGGMNDKMVTELVDILQQIAEYKGKTMDGAVAMIKKRHQAAQTAIGNILG